MDILLFACVQVAAYCRQPGSGIRRAHLRVGEMRLVHDVLQYVMLEPWSVYVQLDHHAVLDARL